MRWVAALVGSALLLAACSGGSDDADLKPHPLPGSATTVVDYSDVALAKVPGTTTTTVREQGTATIQGSVSGPGGLVPGATVRVEHLTADHVVRTDVVTGADGRFVVPNIPGGRYRVRAFLAPTLALVTPDVRFIEDGKPATFDLTVQDQRKVVARAAVNPQAPYLGDDVNLAVVVANQTVDSDGIVRSIPLPGIRVELSGLGTWTLKGPDQVRTPGGPKGTTTTTSFFPSSTVAFTDGVGQVRYTLRCTSPGDPSLELLVNVTVTPASNPGDPASLPVQQVQHLDLAVPGCIDPSTAPTATTNATKSSTKTTATDAGGAEDDG